MGVGGFEGKALYFCGGGRDCCCFFFQSSGRLAFMKMYNFLQVVVFLKNAVLWVSFVHMGSFGANTLYYIPVKPG